MWHVIRGSSRPKPLSSQQRARARRVGRWKQYPDEAEFLAYDIAGLLATSLARKQLAKNDPYYLVLEMAGDLDLPEEVAGLRRPLSTWPMMARLIAALPAE